MKKLAPILLALGLFGCGKLSESSYMKWHRLQGEMMQLNDEETVRCKQKGQAWGFIPGTNVGPMCIDVPKQEAQQQPAAVKK